jgi:hypothetical protein
VSVCGRLHSSFSLLLRTVKGLIITTLSKSISLRLMLAHGDIISMEPLTLLFSVVSSFLLLPSSMALSSLQALWNSPNGMDPDLTETYTSGDSVLVSWNSWPSTVVIDPIATKVNLWVTSVELTDTYSSLIKGTSSMLTILCFRLIPFFQRTSTSQRRAICIGQSTSILKYCSGQLSSAFGSSLLHRRTMRQHQNFRAPSS